MLCYKHPSKEAVGTCIKCGRGLCQNCTNQIDPPMCLDCARTLSNEIKSEMVKNILISVVLMIVGVLVIKSPGGILLAGIPYGWTILNRMTPSMFLWLSFVGWIVYFLIKLVLAYVIGIPALIFKMVRWISELSRVNKLTKCIDKTEV